MLASEQRRLELATKDASDLLAKARLQASELDAQLEDALTRTRTPQATYKAGGPLERRILNQTFFTRILIGEDNQVLGTTLTPTYAAVAAWHPELGQPQISLTDGPEGLRRPTTALQAALDETRSNPDPSSWDQGLTFERLVETAGIEPASAIA